MAVDAAAGDSPESRVEQGTLIPPGQDEDSGCDAIHGVCECARIASLPERHALKERARNETEAIQP